MFATGATMVSGMTGSLAVDGVKRAQFVSKIGIAGGGRQKNGAWKTKHSHTPHFLMEQKRRFYKPPVQ
jgi:hypothetical protein